MQISYKYNKYNTNLGTCQKHLCLVFYGHMLSVLISRAQQVAETVKNHKKNQHIYTKSVGGQHYFMFQLWVSVYQKL